MAELPHRLRLVLAAGLLAAAAAPSPAGDQLHIVQPGYPGSTLEAKDFLRDLASALRDGGAAGLSAGEYHNVEADGLQAIRRDRPRLAILSLGMYLKHRRELELKALAWSQPATPFHLLVRKGAFKSLAELRGRRITGTPFVDQPFAERFLFGAEDPSGRPPADLGEWTIEAAQSSAQALRKTRDGRFDAVLLSDPEYRSAQQLQSAAELEALHTTAVYPAAVVVAFGAALSKAETEAAARACAKLKEGERGRELLKTMGIESMAALTAADGERLAAFERRYDGGAVPRQAGK